jgi:hypothetical protein
MGQTYGAASAVTGGYIRGSGANQAGAVIFGAAAVARRQPLGPTIRSRPC